MTLHVYNTLSRKKEEFVPLKDKKVGMYVCGITAYDSCHLGHARAAVVFDVISRYLRYRNYDLNYVRNYTDIDDKIINRANKESTSCEELSKKYIKEYQEDMKGLDVKIPDIEPKATDHIKEMIDLVQKLVDKGLAYESQGSVYFKVRAFKGYGKLSRKNIEELEAGARVEVDETKEDPLDFALWKASKPDEPKWPSPWGEGRPGWHIECSVMSTKYLGQPFDIHGGGRDLVFPHHENEIAQAEGACGCQFARYWIHNGFININTEKMSKSLGNIKTIREIREVLDTEVIRYFLLSNHYRSPIDYTEENMTNAWRAVSGFYESLEPIADIAGQDIDMSKAKFNELEGELMQKVEGFKEHFIKVMDDDFNTANAVGSVFEILREVNNYVIDKKKVSSQESKAKICRVFVDTIKNVSQVLGFFGSTPIDYKLREKKFGAARFNLDPKKVEELIGERSKARKEKDFVRADEIREELKDQHVKLKDRPDNTTEWAIEV